MEQSSERTTEVPRGMIFGLLAGPLLPGLLTVLNVLDDPQLHGVRGPSVVRLIAIGWCAGIIFSGLMLLINTRVRRSSHAAV